MACLLALLACSGKALRSSGTGGEAPTGQAGDQLPGGSGGGGGAQVAASGGAAPAASLVSIAITPGEATLVLDARLTLSVTGTYSNDVDEDLQTRLTLVSSDPSVATVRGVVVVAKAPGVATITASYQGFEARASITVEAKTVTAISVTTDRPSLTLGQATQAHALALMDDGSMQDMTPFAVWTSSKPQVARLTDTGFLIAMGSGSTKLTASIGKVTGSAVREVTGATLTSFYIVGAHVLFVPETLWVGLRAAYDTGQVTNQTDATWRSTDESVATVSEAGGVTALSAGKTIIEASLGTSVVASTEVVVTGAKLQAIAIVGGDREYPFCEPPVVRVMGTFSDSSQYDVTHLPFAIGSENLGLDRAADHGIAIFPYRLGAARLDIDIDIDNDQRLEASVELTALLGSPESVEVGLLDELPVSATYSVQAYATCADAAGSVELGVVWSTDDPAIATIEARGKQPLVVAVGPGTTSIRGTYPGLEIPTTSLKVYAATPVRLDLDYTDVNLRLNSDVPILALGLYEDGHSFDLTHACTWSTLDPKIVSVSNQSGSKGVVTAVSTGMTALTARFGGLIATTRVSVFPEN